jgi:fibronectin-binding autotransporter adhesin
MFTKKLFKLSALLVVLTIVLSISAFAQTTIYVSATNGDDTFGAGTALNPYSSISKAIGVATTGSTISVQAGTYQASTVRPVQGTGTGDDALAVTGSLNLTFVATALNSDTTVWITKGININTTGTVNLGITGKVFNLGTTATALQLTAGTLNISPYVVFGSGGTLTVGNGTMVGVPSITTALNVTFNGTNAVASTSAYLPNSLGTGLLTCAQASSALTIDNASLTCGGITVSGGGAVTIASNITSTANINITGAAAVTLNGNLTLGTATAGAACDIINANSGTLTVGASSTNTLTTYSTVAAGTVGTDANVGEIKNTATGKIIINSTVTENIKNTGVNPNGGDQTALTITLPVITNTGGGAAAITINGNINFVNTNVVGTAATDNQVSHTVTISNSGAGAVSFAGSITTPASTAAFTTPANVAINVMLSNTGGGTLATRGAALRGAAGTQGITNSTAAGTMTLGQPGDAFTTNYDIMNDFASSTLTLNGTGTLGGALTNNNAGSVVALGANQTIAGLVTNTGKIKLNTYTLTLTKTAAAALAGAGDMYSVTTATIGTGVVAFTGAVGSSTYTGNLPNVQIASGTSFSLAGNTIWGNLVTSGSGTVSLAAATVIKGDFNLTGSGVVTVSGNSSVAGNVNMTAGSITLAANLTVSGTFTMPQGTFNFGSSSLILNGNFNRTAGTITPGTGTLDFEGTAPQAFNPGTQMNVYNVTVHNTGTYVVGVIANDIVTVSGSLFVLKDFSITSGQVQMGINNIRMEQNNAVGSARFTNDGRGYIATGIGGVIFEGSGAEGVNPNDGAVITPGTSSNAFSNIFVRLTTPTNNVYCLGAVKISGVVTLDGGGIIWNAASHGTDAFTSSTLTLDQSLTTPGYPTVVINTANAHGGGSFLTDGADGGALGAPQPAFSASCLYNLSYTGSTGATMLATDFVTGYVNNLSLVQGTGKTIVGLASMTILGNLSVDPLETLNLTGAGTLTLSSNSGAHVVNGTVTAGTVAITGNAATITGGVGTSNTSSIAILTVTNASGSFTSTGMKVLGVVTINGTALVSNITMNTSTATLTTFTNTAGTTTLNLASAAVSAAGNYVVTAGSVLLTMGSAAATATLGGTLAVDGGTLTLGSNVWVTGAVTHDGSGVIALGNYNLTLANNYNHNNTATFSAGTGAVVAGGTAGTQNYVLTTTATTAVTIPNFTVNATGGIQIQSAGLIVSNSFVHTAGAVDLNSLPLTISGNTWTYTAGTYANTGAASTGVVNLTGTSLVINGDGSPSLAYVTINTTGSVTINPTSAAAARTLTITQLLTQTKGTLALGINDINFATGGTGYTFTAGSITATSTGTNFAKIGELIFNGATGFTPGTHISLTIPNLTINAATSIATTDSFYVANNLTFGLAGAFSPAAGQMILNNGVAIYRVGAGTLSNVPQFVGVVDVTYMTTGTTTGKELPTSATALRNLTISIATTLNAPTTVNGTLTLGAALTTTATNYIAPAVGSTINVAAGGSIATAVKPVGAYNLTYSGAAALLTTDNEWPSTATITTLLISMGATTPTDAIVSLHANRSVANLTLNCITTGSGLDLTTTAAGTAAYNLTVSSLTTLTKGTLKTTTTGGTVTVQGDVNAAGGSFGGTLQMAFTGSVNQTITTPNGGASVGNITINKPRNSIVIISGGDLTCSGIVTFTNGLVQTGTANALVLTRVSGSASQGFVHNTTGTSHVVGNVRQNLITSNVVAFAAHDFPVGDVVNYRPATLTFYNANAGGNIALGVTATVSHQSVRPTGTTGLPITDGIDATTDLSRYPSFYWAISTSSSLGATTFNLGLTAAGYDTNEININDVALNRVKMIRRSGGPNDQNNSWNLQGSDYDNYVLNNVPTVVNVGSTSGLIPGGAIYTYGLKSNLVILNKIADQVLTATNKVFKVKLGGTTAPVFGGNTGTLVFSVSSSNTTCVSANLLSDTLVATNLRAGTATITVTATDVDNSRITTSFNVTTSGVGVEIAPVIPTEYSLSQNYPNPFNPSTTIEFGLPTASNVTLKVYNMLGEEVASVVNQTMSAGYHTVTFDGSKFTSGMYIYRITAGNFVQVKKMMMLK